MTTPTPVREVNERGFAQDVLQRSAAIPVVVDFWAPWCGPCRVLGPVLERGVAAHAGQIELVKVNTDENPSLARQHRIEGIPAVKAFRDGRVVDEFTGALPEPQVRAFLERLLPSQADQLAAAAATRAYAGDRSGAEDDYRRAIEADRGHVAANLGLARLLVARGEDDEALRLLEHLPGNDEAQRLRAELNFRRRAEGTDRAALEQRLAADPRDVNAHYRLATLLAAEGSHEAALEHLLEVVRLDRRYEQDAGRRAMLDLFTLLGDSSPLTQQYRRRLSSLLF